jgi:Lipase (class 3).
MDKAGTQGFISRDDSKKEIVVSFRGSMEIKDAWTSMSLTFKCLFRPVPTIRSQTFSCSSRPCHHLASPMLVVPRSTPAFSKLITSSRTRWSPASGASWLLVPRTRSSSLVRRPFVLSVRLILIHPTGHSLGGAVGSLAALSLKYALPNLKLKLYTYGQPRVGNAAFASLVESRVGVNNIFRATHTYGTMWCQILFFIPCPKACLDGVPTILLKPLGYRHL